MKKILPIVLIIICFCNCKTAEKNKDGFIITAYLRGLKSDSVYLYNTYTKTYKSIAVGNQRFTLSGNLEYPEMFDLYLNKEETKFLNIFLENSEIDILGNVDSLEQVNIEGSKANEEYQAYRKLIQNDHEILDELYVEYDNASNNLEYEKADSLDVLVNTVQQSILKRTYAYSIEHHQSSIIPYITYTSSMSAPNRKVTNDIILSLNEENKKNPRIAQISAMFEANSRTEVGGNAPQVQMETNSGSLISLNDLKGKVVLLDFWASWCTPCIKSFPELKELYQKFPNTSFEILSISIDKDKSQWEKAVERNGLSWPQIRRYEGGRRSSTKRLWNSIYPHYVSN